jgi:hypothetical protein
MKEGRLAVVVSVFGLVFAGPRAASASISNSLEQFLNRSINLVSQTPVGFPNLVGEFIQREALGSIQLPVPANSTSFTFSYNPSLGVFERSSGSLGPVFVDRAETVGAGHFDLIFSYQFANLKNFNGDNFGPQLIFGFLAPSKEGATVAGVFAGRNFSLKENVFAFNGTYGITDRWDVNLLVPMLYTTLDFTGDAINSVNNVPTNIVPASFHDKAFGIGDILLRTKYRFLDDPEVVLMAAALTLRMPSGSPDNFQGLGDFTITPALIVSRPFGRNDVHMNLAMEFDTMNGDRTRARYGIGTTLQPLDQLAFLIDILGSSGLDNENFSIPRGNVQPFFPSPTSDFITNVTPTQVNAFVPRSDIVDLSTGIKFNPFATANIYLLAIIPLTQQGLRAAVIPAGGFEWTF